MDDPASSSFLLFFQNNDSAASITAGDALVSIIVIALVVALNAFFVASEFALVTVRRTRIQKLAEEKRGGAEAVLRLLDNPTRFISAVQLGVTLASLALGWLGEPTIARLLRPVAEAIVGEDMAAVVAQVAAYLV